MNDTVTTAVTNVTPIRGNKAGKTAAPVATTAPTRGRAPVVLKNGKLLADARNDAKIALVAAKTEAKARSAEALATEKQAAVLAKSVDGLQTQVAQLEAAKTTLKEALAEQKGMFKAGATAAKESARASISLEKAQTASDAIESEAAERRAA